jgi:RimJ/RimL family protein N-acetyltransferase
MGGISKTGRKTSMRRKSTENNEEPILNVAGELVALGPLRRDLLPLYQRWINDLGTMRTLGLSPLPMTSEKEQDWYDRQSKTEDDVPFTIYEKGTLRPIGNTGLHGVDHRNRSATFGILIGEPECRGKGYGTESTSLMLDYAFTALGLHNVMLMVLEFNPAGSRIARNRLRSIPKMIRPNRLQTAFSRGVIEPFSQTNNLPVSQL